MLLWAEYLKDKQVLTGSNPVLVPQVFRCSRTFITAAKTGFTLHGFQKENEIWPVLALGKGANILILSSLPLPTSFFHLLLAGLNPVINHPQEQPGLLVALF